jgi:NADPH:quinone reductase-like Zn-dependent oxidoreductase
LSISRIKVRGKSLNQVVLEFKRRKRVTMSDSVMQAIQAQDYGGPEVLVPAQVPFPEPNAGQVLIQLKAAGVNPADWKIRSGYFKQFMPLQFPWTPGMEGAGTIQAVGANVAGFKKGQAVYGIVSGAYAEYALAAAGDIQPKPERITFEEAASLPVGVLTAWAAVIDTANVQTGQRVLVHGGAGGVGAYAVQLARWKGAHVTATASAGNLEFIRSLGAENVIDYNATHFEDVVHDLDVVIDTVGGDLPERSWQAIRPGGIFVTVAGRLAEDAGKAQSIRAVGAGRAPTENLKKVCELVEAGKLKPVVGTLFTLEQAREAQELSQTGHGRGRIILEIVNSK